MFPIWRCRDIFKARLQSHESPEKKLALIFQHQKDVASVIIVPKQHFSVVILRQLPGNFHDFRITGNEQKSLAPTEGVTRSLKG